MCEDNIVSWGIITTAGATADKVIAENGINLPVPLSLTDYIASKPQGTCWLQKSRWGNVCLVSNDVVCGADLILTFGSPSQPAYPSYPGILFGGVPHTRPPHVA